MSSPWIAISSPQLLWSCSPLPGIIEKLRNCIPFEIVTRKHTAQVLAFRDDYRLLLASSSCLISSGTIESEPSYKQGT